MYQEILNSPEVVAIKEKYEAAGKPFDQYYEKAFNAANREKPHAVLEKIAEIVISYLVLYLDEQTKGSQKWYSKLWRWVRTLGGLRG